MRPDARVLDRNLRALLARAYLPAMPSPEFRARLTATLARESARRGPPAARRPRLLRPALVALAAGLLVAAGFLWRAALGPEPRAPTLEELLARAPVALGSAAGWREATAEERAHGLVLGTEALELALADGASFEVRVGDGRIAAAGAARLALEPSPVLSGSLASGRVVLTREADEPRASAAPWRLRTEAGELALVSGEVEVERAGEVERFLLRRGSARFAGAHAEQALAPGEALVLVGGVPEGGALAASSPAGAPDRRPLSPAAAELPAPPVPDTSGATGVLGEVRGADGAPAPSFRVALLPQRVGNLIHSPLVRDFGEAHGAFRWDDVPPGIYRPFVWAEGTALAARDELELTAGGLARLDVELERGGTIRGRVVDAATGAGIADALVLSERDVPEHALVFGPADLEQWLPASARTRADGSFELEHLSSGPHTLRAGAPGFAPAWTPALAVAEGETAESEIALGPGGALAGRVLGADGLGRPGEQIIVTPMDESLHPQMNMAHGLTDQDGAFRFADLPPGYLVVITLQQGSLHPVVKPAEIRAGATTEIEFRSEPSSTRLAGRVLHADGRPVALENLALYPRERALDGRYEDFLATSTREDGGFLLENLAPGSHLLYRVGLMGRWVRLIGEVEVPPLPSFEHDVVLEGLSLEGTVRARLGGAVVAGAVLLLERLDPGTGRAYFAGNSESDADGRFRFDDLPAGSYRVAVHPIGGGLGHGRSAAQRLGPGTPSATADVELGEGGSIEVHALDDAGQPVAKAEIAFVDAEGDSDSFARFPLTDASGLFLAQGVSAGRYRVLAQAAGFRPGTAEVECRALERAQVDVVLERTGDAGPDARTGTRTNETHERNER